MLKLKLIPIVIIIILWSSSSVDKLIALSVNGDNETISDGPDEDCLYDPSMPKCIPGPEGYPVGFAMNAYEQCFPRHEGGCPEGYHSHEDDESGRCIPDDIPCDDGYTMNPGYPECQRIEYVCEKYQSLIECITQVTDVQNTSSRTTQ
jgi:hypothetical protein